MQIHFTGHNIDLTPALKSYSEEKLLKLTQRGDEITSLKMTFKIENVTHIAEATVHLRGSDLHATAQSDDMYAAIDLLVDKLNKQVVKHHEKITGHR